MKAIIMFVAVGGDEEKLMFTEDDDGIITAELGKKTLFTAERDNLLNICQELLETFTKPVV
jgi:hypothetical protein